MQKNEIVINYHITEKCNYSCHYCFAKYGLENQQVLEIHNDLEKVTRLLKSVYSYFKQVMKIKKIRLNFAGGEPLIIKSFPSIIKIAKEIGYDELSLITNASALTKKFISENIRYFSMLGISIDSFDEKTNIKIGRSTSSNQTLNIYSINEKISYAKNINENLFIKINTVITNDNYMDSMYKSINIINPNKWKIFKVVKFLNGKGITNEKFKYFIRNNKLNTNVPMFVEDENDMEDSYIMIDPLGRFYQNTGNLTGYKYSEFINEVGAEVAFQQITFDRKKFNIRYVAINETK